MPLPRSLIAQRFSHAARAYLANASLQREAQDELLERLTIRKRDPDVVLDLGCGPGQVSALLMRRFPKAQIIALDLAMGMLRETAKQQGWFRRFHPLCADMHALPLQDHSVDLVYSNLALQWSDDLPRLFAELRRVMKPGALLLYSSFGPDTLNELREAWASIDDDPHVHGFADLPYHGDRLMAAGFRDPVVDNWHVSRAYPDVLALMRELKAIGATRVLAGQRKGLYGKQVLQRLAQCYPKSGEQGIGATWELVFGMGFAPEPGQAVRLDGMESASFPVEHLRRRPLTPSN